MDGPLYSIKWIQGTFEAYIFFYGDGHDMCRTHAFIPHRSPSDECAKFTKISDQPNPKHQTIG